VNRRGTARGVSGKTCIPGILPTRPRYPLATRRPGRCVRKRRAPPEPPGPPARRRPDDHQAL